VPVDPESSAGSKQALFVQRVVIATTVVFSISLLLLLLYYAVQVLFLAFAGVMLAIVIRAAADQLSQRTRLPSTWAVVVVLTMAFLAAGALGFFMAPQFAEQIDELRETVPKSFEQFVEWLREKPWGKRLIDESDELAKMDDGQFGVALARVSGYAYSTVSIAASFVIVGFVALYLSMNPGLYTYGFLRLVPFSYRPRAAQILDQIGHTLRRWLLASLIKMSAVGAMTFVGLWLLDMPLVFILAFIAFLLDFVPYFGPIIAAVPAVLIAFVDGPSQALSVAIMYTVVQQVESMLIAPVLFHRTVYLPPVITVLAQIFLSLLVGVLGILLATPLAAAVLVAVRMIYVEDVLGDYADELDRPIDRQLR